MSERERLIELLLESEPIKERDLDDDWGDNEISDIAEHLIKNGVVVPPVKLGDVVYVRPDSWTYDAIFAPRTSLIIAEVISVIKTKRQTFIKLKAHNKTFPHYKYKRYIISAIGATVFLTKEEAEKALKGGAE